LQALPTPKARHNRPLQKLVALKQSGWRIGTIHLNLLKLLCHAAV
jgi:hypothetical protein